MEQDSNLKDKFSTYLYILYAFIELWMNVREFVFGIRPRTGREFEETVKLFVVVIV